MMRTKATKLLTILLHFFFWGFFTLLYLQQNPDADIQECLDWLTVLGVSAVAVYTNLYFLFPIYFFQKKYFTYSAFLLLIIVLGSFLLKIIFPTSNASFAIPVFQHFINLLFFVVITSSFKFFREYSRKQKALIKAENEQLKTELSILKAQVHPHFLFNTLNNLYGLITQNQNQKASEVTLKLSGLMRYLLDSSKAETLSLRAEIRFIEDYASLEKIRLSKNADIRFEVSGIDEDVFIPPLLFIPLVENAFKHGLNTISEEKFAHFALYIQNKELYFEAKNSIGKSMENHSISGTGLANLRKRLELIYPGKHQLAIEETGECFKIILHIEL